jgi:hypothetical protein
MAEIDHAGVFARTLQHPRAFGRELLQVTASFCSCIAAP